MKLSVFLFMALLTFGKVSFAFDHSHAYFGLVLKEYVKDAKVDYAALKGDQEVLEDYLDSLASVAKEEFDSWTEEQQLAHYINYYNAQTLKLIIDYYPIKSIRDIGFVFSGPWDKQVVFLFGKWRSLDYLEHVILRKEYDEPRIHFALVCAAKGCPPLREEPYVAKNLDEQLEDQGRVFLGEKEKNRLEMESKTLFLSPIFKWFKKDFQRNGMSVHSFVANYLPLNQVSPEELETYKLKYTEYDWYLNDLTD